MGTARAPCSASGVPPACSARVRKPKVCSAIGLLLVYLPACVRGVDSGSILYCATSGGVHQVRVPICRLLRIMTGYFSVSYGGVAHGPVAEMSKGGAKVVHFSPSTTVRYSDFLVASFLYPPLVRLGRYFSYRRCLIRRFLKVLGLAPNCVPTHEIIIIFNISIDSRTSS